MKEGLFTYTRGTVALYRLYILFKAYQDNKIKDYDGPKKIAIIANREDKIWWSWSEERIKYVGKRIWEKTSTPEGEDEHLNFVTDVTRNAIKKADEIKALYLKNLNAKELIKRHQKFYEDVSPAEDLTMEDVDAVDIIPVEMLKDLLKKEQSNLTEKEFLELYGQLASPIFTSYVSMEEKATINLLIKAKEKKISVDKIINSELYPLLKEIIEKFWWTSLGWENANLRTTDDFLTTLKEYQKNVPDLQKRIKEIDNAEQEKMKLRKKLIKDFNLSPEVIARLRFFDRYAVLHDLRKEMQMRLLHSDNLFLQQFSALTGIEADKLQWFNYEDIYDFVLSKKKFVEEEYEKRRKAYFLSNENGTLTYLIGNDATKKIKEYYSQDLQGIIEIKGVCSSPGKISGRVKVCSGYQEAIKKVELGDILVTGMTLLDYAPAMRKAAAIITDEGGITCHAAIVSREMGKPCLTSTKIATQVLKDNDLIELDGNNGIITIIKRAKNE